jgi:DNA-directed RNA polymerase specialized sigma24 family protein
VASVDDLLAPLPPQQAKYLRAHYGLDGHAKSQTDIAAEQGCSKSNVQQLIARGIENLRTIWLGKEGRFFVAS